MTMKLTTFDDFDPSKPGYGMRAANKTADIFIYEEVGDGWLGGLSAKRFADDLKALGKLDTINLFVNSPGGSVFDGVAIYQQLKRNPARVVAHVDGLAASIASLIVMAADEIKMASNGLMMIHNAWTVTAGNAVDLREQADVLDKVDRELTATYANRTGVAVETVSEMMAAETWMTADEAVEHGFADSKTEELRIAACVFDLSKLGFKHAPKMSAPVIEPKPEPEPSVKDQIVDWMNYTREMRKPKGASR
jgi:ATP-dependent Clp endopeptidase proteolytic subunit ClpP